MTPPFDPDPLDGLGRLAMLVAGLDPLDSIDPDPRDVTGYLAGYKLDVTDYLDGYEEGWNDGVLVGRRMGRVRPPLLGYVLVALSATVVTALIAVAVMGLR